MFFVAILFSFFAERNDAPVSFFKSIIKILLAGAIVLGIAWIVSFFTDSLTSLVFGSIIGLFFFITLWKALGWLTSILVTLLTLISTLFVAALVLFLMRLIFDSLPEAFSSVVQEPYSNIVVFLLSGFVLGTFLILTQLHTSLFRAFSQTFIATVFATVLVTFIMWIGAQFSWGMILIFGILYAALLWILRFRMTSDLFAETVRIVRVSLILVAFLWLVHWIVF